MPAVPQTSAPAAPPTRLRRLLIAIGIGAFAATAVLFATSRPGFDSPDFRSFWLAGGAILDGANPYEVVKRQSGPGIYFFHPLPAALLSVPFALAKLRVGHAAFSGMSAGLLAYVATARSYNPLLLFLSASFVHAAVHGQWSMLLTVAVFAPAFAFVGAAKPNIGLAIVATLASWRAVAAMVAVTALSFLVMPTWPAYWLDAVRSSVWHYSPLKVHGGLLAVLALLRWRRPEARLLGAMSVLPQSPFTYEALPLFFVPRSRPEFYVLLIGSDLAHAVYYFWRDLPQADYLQATGTAVAAFMYLPATVMVLRRPNEGALPGAIEPLVTRLPAWLRGTPAAR